MSPSTGIAEIRQRLLPATTVRIYVGGERTGTGFFVGPGAVATCKHVLRPLDLADPSSASMVGVTGRNKRNTYEVTHIRHYSTDEDDLAVLRVKPGTKHPCALLHVGLDPGDEVHSFGYTALHDAGIPTSLEAEGLTGDSKFFKLKEGRVEHGMSGSPILNVVTGAVCGILTRTIDAGQSAGGYAIPITSLFKLSDAIASQNQAFHKAHPRWVELLPGSARQVYLAGQRAEQQADPPALRMTVTVEPKRDWWEVTATLPDRKRPARMREVGPERVELNKVRLQVARLFRDWASPDSSWRGRVNRGEEVRLLGTILATAVLPGKIRKAVEGLLSNRPAGWVQITLRFTGTKVPPDLEYLPWEHLFIDKSRTRGESYLAREQGFAFARANGSKSRRKEPARTSDLSVLLACARPPGKAESERALAGAVKSVMTEARELLGTFARVTFTVEEPSDPAHLAALVKQHQPTVVHYLGYGRFLDDSDEIAIGHSAGEATYVDAETFSGLLAGGIPKLVVAQLCDASPTMDLVRADAAPFAPAVLGRDVQALVAYQYPAESDECEVFNEALYSKLVAGAAVELAVQEGRHALWLSWPKERAFLAPTVAIRGAGGLRLTTEAADSSDRTFVSAAPGYG